MPSARQLAWMVGITLVTTIALEKYRTQGGPKVAVRRVA